MGQITVRIYFDKNSFETFQRMTVYLVDNPNWTELLIGRPTLKQKNLLPSQMMRQRNQPQQQQQQQNQFPQQQQQPKPPFNPNKKPMIGGVSFGTNTINEYNSDAPPGFPNPFLPQNNPFSNVDGK